MADIAIAELERMLERISGPWRSMREGNQYLNDGAEVVGASRVDGLDRPWNPRYVIAPSDLEEVSRFRDDDADFIAAAPGALRSLLSRLRTLEAALVAVDSEIILPGQLKDLVDAALEGSTAAGLGEK